MNSVTPEHIYKPHLESICGHLSADYKFSASHAIGLYIRSFGMLRSIDSFSQYVNPGSFNIANLSGLNYTDTWRLSSKPRYDAQVYYKGRLNRTEIHITSAYYHDKMGILAVREEGNSTVLGQQNYISNQLWAGKIQLGFPLLNGMLRMGVEANRTKRTDKYIYDGSNGESSIRYESQHALFMAYSQQKEKWNWKAGVRYEQTNSHLNLVHAQPYKYKHEGFYPYASATFHLQNGSMNLTYGFRSQRPTYNQLSTFSLVNSYLQIIHGNPKLKPAIYQQWAVSWKLGCFYGRLGYQTVNRFIANNVSWEKGLAVLEYDNIPTAQLYSATLALASQKRRWSWNWSVSMAGQFVKQDFDNGKSLSYNRPLLSINLHQQYSISSDWQCWADFQYHNTGHVGTTLLHHSGAVNLGIVHRLGDWTFRIEGKDLLATSLSDQTWYGAIRDLHRRIYHDTRRVEISVGYNIRFRLSKNPDYETAKVIFYDS